MKYSAFRVTIPSKVCFEKKCGDALLVDIDNDNTQKENDGVTEPEHGPLVNETEQSIETPLITAISDISPHGANVETNPFDQALKTENSANVSEVIEAIEEEVVGDDKEEDPLRKLTIPKPEPTKKNAEPEEIGEQENFLNEHNFPKIVKAILTKYKIVSSTWTQDLRGDKLVVDFTVPSGKVEEEVMEELLAVGVGTAEHSSLSISSLLFNVVPSRKRANKENSMVTSKSAGAVCQLSSQTGAKPAGLASDILSAPTPADLASDILSAPKPADLASDPVSSAAEDESSSAAPSNLPKKFVDFNGDDLGNDVDVEAVSGSLAETDSEMEVAEGFFASIQSRIIVRPIVIQLKRNAEFTFDYLMFLIIAGVIASIGLIENSSVILVASMLISPLMGPILAGTFGAVIQDPSLTRIGLRSEIIGLTACILTGFLVGLPVVFIEQKSQLWMIELWPAPEMYGRGAARNLLIGAVIALFSGAGVALSILGENSGSLVGVAISASLLPPAVNTGLLWALSLAEAVKSAYSGDTSNSTSSMNFTSSMSSTNASLLALPLVPPCAPESLTLGDYAPVYRCDMAQETAILGVNSLVLTILNIALIIIGAIVFLKIKEVSPNVNREKERDFWNHHVGVAKSYQRTLRNTRSTENLAKTFKEEARRLTEGSKMTEKQRDEFQRIAEIVDDEFSDDMYLTARSPAFSSIFMRGTPGRANARQRSSLKEIHAKVDQYHTVAASAAPPETGILPRLWNVFARQHSAAPSSSEYKLRREKKGRFLVETPETAVSHDDNQNETLIS